MARITEQQKEQIHQLRAEGMSQRAIAEVVGCSQNAVCYIVNPASARHNKAYRLANTEKIAEINKAYRLANAEKVRESGLAYRRANVEKIRERDRRRTNVHKPDSRPPMALIKRIRFKCLATGGWPGSTDDLRLAMIAVGYESPELLSNWLHTDAIGYTAHSWAKSWRNMKPSGRAKWHAMYEAEHSKEFLP